MNFLRTRRREVEWMDDPHADPILLDKSLAFIRRINRRLGYTRVILKQLERFSANWPRGQTIRMIDVATGSADIPLAILRWADARNFKVSVVGVDINPEVARLAAAHANDPRLTLVRASAMDLPMADGSFDYAITSMFLHHLSDEDAERALAEMGRVSQRGVIISDLLRLGYAYAFIWLFTLLSNPMVKHDARVSVAQSFSRAEILALRDRAGLEFAGYRTHLWHRFVLAGER
jgi:ubiquinone/menaquinone biosynthesis C-methylase UbiE